MPEGAGSPEEIEDDEVLVVPVHLDVVVSVHLREISHGCLDLELIEVGRNLQERLVPVGERPPSSEVTGDEILAHLDAALEDLLVLRHFAFGVDPEGKPAVPDEVPRSFIRLEALVPGEVLLLAKNLPELETDNQLRLNLIKSKPTLVEFL